MSTSPRAVVARLRAAGCVFAEEEAALLIREASGGHDLDAMVRRRVAGLPLEQVLGWAEFCGLRIAVDPGVFVPRHRSEFLARAAVEQARAAGRDRAGRAPVVVVDLCCGSGALGAGLIDVLKGVELHACDIDPAATRCARRNLDTHGAHADRAARVHQGDLYRALPADLRDRIDVVVANAPYVPTAAMRLLPPEARLHEPGVTLDGGPDGLSVLRRVIAEAPAWLAPGGHLLVEASADQAPRAADLMTENGLFPQVRPSVEFDATIVVGLRRPRPART